MEDPQNAHDMIDVTDCLEARDAIRGMKNFCFWLMLLSLLILQGLFWLDRGGWIDRGDCPQARSCGLVCSVPSQAPETNGDAGAVEAEAAPAAAKAEEGEEEASVVIEGTIAQQARQVAAEAQAEQSEAEEAQAAEPAKEAMDWSRLKLPWKNISMLIRIFNFLLLFTAVLYCLTLLITLKISLVSRLGGISHISRAFFISLFLLLFLFPWQCLAPGVLIGAMYLPKELLCGYPARAADSKLWFMLMFLRFSGLWLLVFWLLVWSWLRSGKWYRATQRRLGIVQ